MSLDPLENLSSTQPKSHKILNWHTIKSKLSYCARKKLKCVSTCDWQHESPRAFLPCCWVIMRTALSVLQEEQGHRVNAGRLMGTKWTNYDAAPGLWWGQTPPSPRSPSFAPRSPYTDSSISLQRPAFGPHSPWANYEWKVISQLPRRELKQYFRADPHVKMLLETGGAEADSSHTDPGSAKYRR